MSNMEEKLWDYIDGTCSAAERQAIEQLLLTDNAFQEKYQELSALNSEITAIELDEPSMAFTYNVMETIRADYASKPLKARVNGSIIKVIAGFFIIAISAMLIAGFASIDWHSNPQMSAAPIKMPDFTSFLSKPILNSFLFLDTVLVLFLLDGFLRKRLTTK